MFHVANFRKLTMKRILTLVIIALLYSTVGIHAGHKKNPYPNLSEPDDLLDVPPEIFSATGGDYIQQLRVSPALAGSEDPAPRPFDTYPLHKAAYNGDVQHVLELLDEDHNVNEWRSYRTLLRGATPLIDALRFENEEVVRVLCERGADVNLQDSNEATALIIAADSFRFVHSTDADAINKLIDIIATLISHGAEVCHKDNLGSSAISELANCTVEKKRLLRKKILEVAPETFSDALHTALAGD